MKKTAIYLGILLSAVFLWLALRNTNVAEIRQAFARASLWPMIPMFTCLVGFYWLKATRWRLLLSPVHPVTTGQLVPAMMAGAAGNNLLPAHLGEIVRIFYANNKLGIPKSTVLATLVLERVLDIIVVLGLLAFAFVAGDFSRVLVGAGGLLLLIAVVAGFFCVVLTLYNERICSLLDHLLKPLSDPLRKKIIAQIRHIGSGLESLREARLYWAVLASSLGQWMLVAGCIYCAMYALDLRVSPLLAVVVLGITVAGLALPTSPGFFGTIEYCFVLGLAAAGIDASSAISAAIYYHAPVWVAVTVGGLLIVRMNNLSLRQLKDEATQEQ